MRIVFQLLTVAALTIGLSTSAMAQKLDANGRCHDAAGKFAKAEVCGAAKAAPAKAAPAKAVAAAAPAATAPAKAARCKTAKGKFAKCGTPGALPA